MPAYLGDRGIGIEFRVDRAAAGALRQTVRLSATDRNSGAKFTSSRGEPEHWKETNIGRVFCHDWGSLMVIHKLLPSRICGA